MTEIRVKDCSVSLNKAALIGATGEFIAQAALFNITGLVSPIFKAFGAISNDEKVECKAFKLIAETYLQTLLQTIRRVQLSITPAQTQDAANYALGVIDTAVREDVLTFTTLKCPHTLDSFDYIKTSMIRYLQAFIKDEENDTFTAIFTREFDEIFHRLYLGRFSFYREIEDLLNSGVAQSQGFEEAWRKYNISLVDRFENGELLGEEGESRLRLSDVYQALRVAWESTPSTLADPEEPIAARQPSVIQIDMLEETLEAWLATSNPKDTIRLISGVMGSGKSTFAKKLAATYAMRDHWRTLFIPLQRIREGGSLEDRIEEYFRLQLNEPFGDVSPLRGMRTPPNKKWLIIFDGLDELAKEGTAAANAAQEFATSLSDWRARIQGVVDARFVVLGRAPSMQDARRRLDLIGPGTLHVQSMAPIRQHPSRIIDDKELGSIDQREVFWARYAIAKGLSTETPPALTDRSLEDLSKEPLLAYLLIYSGFAARNWELAAENRNRIYREIFRKIWDREREKETRRHLNDWGKDTYDALMQALGLAAWHGGGRTGDEETFEKVKENLLRPSIYSATRNITAMSLQGVAVLFFTRRDEEGRQGFEFLHKSFGEYLAGVALAHAFFRWASQLLSQENEISPLLFLSRWSSVCRYQEFSYEILGFVRREIALITKEASLDVTAIRQLSQACIEPFDLSLKAGVPLDNVAGANFEQIKAWQNNTRVNLLACIISCASLGYLLDSYEKDGPYGWRAGPLHVPFFEDTDAFQVFLKEHSQRVETTEGKNNKNKIVFWFDQVGLITSLVKYLDLSRSDMSWHAFGQFDFESCNMHATSWIGCHFDAIDFSRCDLSSATFAQISTDFVRFTECKMQKSSFTRTTLTKGVFIRSILNDVDFSSCRFSSVAMDLTSLDNADLDGRQSRDVRRVRLNKGKLMPLFHSNVLPDLRQQK